MDDLGKALEMKDSSATATHASGPSSSSEPPLFDEFYLDWAAFDQAVANAIERHHPIRKRSSLTFEVYNKTVSKGRHDRKPIAEFLSKTFKCTHGIKFRSRGTGKRSRHKLRDIGCPFHIYATAFEDGATYRVKVRTHDKHNHLIGPDASKTVDALPDAEDYEYTDAHAAAAVAAASAVISDASSSLLMDTSPQVSTGISSAVVDALPPTSDAELLHGQVTSFVQAHAQATAAAAHMQQQQQQQQHSHHSHHHHHQALHGHANAADILDSSEHDSESLLQSAIDSHIGDFSAAAAAVATAAAAVVDLPVDTTSRALSEEDSKFEETTTLEGLRRKLSEFANDRDWDQFHSPRNLLLALAGEMGELCECFQWKGDNKPVEEWTSEERIHLGDEISDVMMYLIRLADKCEIDLPSAIHEKMNKNAQRFPPDMVRGSAKKFNEFKRARVDREASL